MKIRKIFALFLSLCLIFGAVPITALATDQTNAGAGIRIQYLDGSYDKTTGIMKVHVQAKMPAGTGISSVGTLLSYDNTKLTVVNKNNTSKDVTSDEGVKKESEAIISKTLIQTVDDDENTKEYTLQDSAMYKAGDRSGIYTFHYNGKPGTQKATDAQTGGEWFNVYEVMFRVAGKPDDPATVLNRDSLRIADVAKGDDTVIRGAHPANNIYSIYLTDDSNPAELYVLNRMSGCTETEVTGEKSLMTAPETGTATYPGSTNKPPLPALEGAVTLNSTAWRIGTSMNVETSGITSTSPGTLTYEWYRVDNGGEETRITAASGNSYTPSEAADVGKEIKVKVFAENYSGYLEAISDYTVSKKPYDGVSPTEPTGIITTSNSVSFTKTDNYWYVVTLESITSTAGCTWYNYNGFSSLSSNTKYKLWYRVGETDVMEGSSEQYVEFTTKKSSAAITIADPGTIVYDGFAVEVGSGKDLNYTYNGDGAVTVKWYADNDNAKGSELADGAPKNAGTYWIGVSAAEGSNFNAVTEETKQFTIEKKNLTITANPKTITYGDAPANAGVTYNGFVSDENDSTLIGSLYYDYNYTQNDDVGDNYTITPKGVSNSNYDISFVPGKLTVDKKELTNINTSGVSVTKVYDGTTAAGTLIGSISFTGIVETDDVSITAVPRTYADANVSSTKTVTLDLFLAGAKKDNYKINSTTADISNAEITAYTAVTDKTEKGTSSARIDVLKSSGEFPKVDIDGVGTEKATGTITYSYGSVTNGTWNEVVDALKTADANTDADIQYTFTGNENYAGASITGTIYVKVTDLGFYLQGTSTKADASNGADVATDTTYGKKWSELVSLKNLEAKVGATPIAGTFSIVGADNMPAAGNQTYTVVFTSMDGTYANQTVFTGNVNVAKREVEIKWENAAGRVYGDGKTVTATITNKVGSDDVSLTVADGDKTNAGDYTATASLTGTASANYKLPAVFTQAYTINKATPTGAPSYTEITAAGKTLAEAALAIGTLQPDATGYLLQWVNDSGTAFADTTAVEKNKEYKWLFTPADTANYNTLTGKLTPYYVASSGGSYVPKVQKPEITIIGSGKADLSADGRTATITAAAGHELVSVVLNGKEMGKVEKLTGLKTGDKATITFRAKTDGKAEMDKIIAQKASKLTLMARSKKTAKLNIKVVVKGDLKAITDAGYTVKYKFYRSTKKSAGYKAVLTKKAPTYYNTYGKKGTMYYYKARVMIYDKNGNFVAQTALKQCKYANRLWTK